MATTYVSNASALTAAISAASAADTIVCNDGSYGSITISSKNGSSGSPITIIGATSPASASGAVFSALNLVNCNYITLDSLYVNAQIDMHDPGQCSNIIIQYCKNNGLNANYSDAVTYRFNTCAGAGIYFDRSTNFIADQNYTYDRRGDQFRGAGAAYVTISNNVMYDLFEIQGTTEDPHYDFIQSFAYDGVTPHHWTIYGNITIDNPATGVIGNDGDDRLAEGYFFGSNDGYTYFTIDNNLVVVNSAEGMHMRGGNSTCVFSNNTLFGGGVMMNNMGVGYNDPMEFTDNIGNIYDLALGGAAPNATGNVAFSDIADVLADPYGTGSGGILSWQRFIPLPAYSTKGAATRIAEIQAGTNVYALELAGMTGMGGGSPPPYISGLTINLVSA